MALTESMVALAIIAMVAIAGLSGLATSSRATIIADEQSTAESLARSQMEWVKKASYVSDTDTYAAAAIPSESDYAGYSVDITASPLNVPDDGIQKITIAIGYAGRQVLTLEGYKVNR
jgi:type II secretory pathway pseudopilin PulG